MLDREPDGELKLDLDGKLVVPNIIELTCIKQYTVLVFQQSKTYWLQYSWQCHCKKNCEETYETDRPWSLSMQTWWQTAKMVLLAVVNRGWLQRVPCAIYGELQSCSLEKNSWEEHVKSNKRTGRNIREVILLVMAPSRSLSFAGCRVHQVVDWRMSLPGRVKTFWDG